MNENILTISNLTKQFGEVRALDHVSFDLQKGEVHALCGENGAGKSTLIKCLSGIWSVDSYEGDILVDGVKSQFRSINDATKAGIGVIYQELALVREMTIAENLFLGDEPTDRIGKIDWHKIYSESASILQAYDLDLDPTTKISDLGIGQQQLVEIVKALLKQTRVLLLDEPTAALTETEVDLLLEIIRGLRKRGVTCVYISHKLDEVMAIADRVTVLRDGKSVATCTINETDKSDIIRQMVGRDINNLFPRRSSQPGLPLLSVSNLSVNEPDSTSLRLDAISFEVKAGEVLGIGGLMGAGRTELIMHIFGAYGERVSGKIEFKQIELHAKSPSQAIDAGMMMVSEDRKRYGLVLDKHIGFNESLASLKEFSRGPFINKHAENKTNREYFQSLRVKAPNLESIVGGLSGGNQQKVVLAKALMTRPSLVFLDEPTRGIDVGAKLEVYELMNQLTDQGKAVIMVSSEMPELIGMSDRIIVLSEGKIGGTFEASKVTQQELLEAAMAHC